MGRARSFFSKAALGLLLGFVTRKVVDRLPPRRQVGWNANGPAEMPFSGWMTILSRFVREVARSRILMIAAGVAFYALLAVVPGLSILISVYGLVADPAGFAGTFATITDIIPEAAARILADEAARLAGTPRTTLSLSLVISLALAGWSANSATKGLFDAFNVIHHVEERRSFLHLTAVSLATTLSVVVFFVTTIIVIGALPLLVNLVPIPIAIEKTALVVRWPILWFSATIAFMLVYWIGHARRPGNPLWLMPGAALAATLWALVSALFAWYAGKLGNYSASYGSLAAVIVFMTWLWLSALAILLGAQFNAAIEQQVEIENWLDRRG